MSCLLQDADNEITTNGCCFSLIGLVATQLLVILGYMHINIYFLKSQGNPSVLKQTDHLTGNRHFIQGYKS